jgi:organic hydroperoxide reductase OsmC/OhrA
VHSWHFDGGIEVRASPSPHVVRAPFSDAEAVDPEEAFVASLSSCHMLMFLSIAARRGFTVDEYVDEAVGYLEKRADGMLWMSRVTLRPKTTFSGASIPAGAELKALHDQAHHECFIANSVKTLVECELV